jgi:hypothetical protein
MKMERVILPIIIVLAVIAGPAAAEDPVYFADSNLKVYRGRALHVAVEVAWPLLITGARNKNLIEL